MKNFGDKDAGQDSVYNWRAKNLTRCQQVDLIRPAKLSKVHFSRKFQGKMHLNFWLSGSPITYKSLFPPQKPTHTP